ncbi:hypothetical protein B0H12DRAFT_1093494 [Mycena haematopus]|nr:hypothetical protein B0H12DRAFT_1093494 [Mycena haematopus]
MQMYNYYRDYPKDRLILKVMVIVTWLLELVHSILLWNTIYSLTVTFYCDSQHLETPPKTLYFTLLCSSLITVIVQFFFCYRIWRFSGQKLVPVICCCLSGLYLAGMLASLALFCVGNTLAATLDTYHWLPTAVFSLTSIIDVAIAISMCYWLSRVRSAGFPKTRNIVDTLIIWCIESTVIKSGASVIQLILFETRSDLLWLIFLLPKASLFSNSMLAALNGRNRIINSTSEVPTFITFSSANPAPPRPSRNLVVQMTHITEIHVEDDEPDEHTVETKADIEELDLQKKEECH